MKFKVFTLLLLLVTLVSVPVAFASDPEPTILSNKEAIDLVQTHANYLWTDCRRTGVFYAGRFCHGGGRLHPGEKLN
ncbi:hypothetical protein [Desulfosarcina cetonica]|uniref:hypothetical protein n=1 Tax=Desulfosarcina cetonica TaxID=90730 RepID=UPI001FEEC833|nr:hypothetical protein [Desulfosarcina cetonica]